jgi:hypothetical protein
MRSKVGHSPREIAARSPVNGAGSRMTADLPPGAPLIEITTLAPGWRNWQTQQTQNLPPKGVWVRSPPWAPTLEEIGQSGIGEASPSIYSGKLIVFGTLVFYPPTG